MQSVNPPVIAVVDDDPRVLESLDNLLQSVGYEVRCFNSGPALLEGTGLAGIDCLITDVGLPGMSGFALQQIALAERPELPVILITARYPLGNPLAAQPNNRGVFQKPFNVDELLGAVAAAIGGAP